MTVVCESTQKDSPAIIALGGNKSQPRGEVSEAIWSSIQEIASQIGKVVATSRFFRTPAFPAGSGPDFVNAAVIVRTRHRPDSILSRLHSIEQQFGRERITRWGERTLDLDLLGVGDTIWPDEATVSAWIGLPPEDQRRTAPDRLILPHPRLQDRAFVLVPLLEIAPGWRHPVLGRTVAEMAAALPDADKAAICPV